MLKFATAALCFALIGCSSCSPETASSPTSCKFDCVASYQCDESGVLHNEMTCDADALVCCEMPSSDADADSDGDADSDSDGDTDSDTDTVSDAGPWDWEDLPDAGDCGQEGCEQLSFTEGVKVLQWDVWDDVLVFVNEDSVAFAVNIVDKRVLPIPNFHSEHPLGLSEGNAMFYPSVAEGVVYHGQKIYVSDPRFSEIIQTDLTGTTQTIIFRYEEDLGQYPDPAKYLDIYGNRLVSAGGCGGFGTDDLCFFPLPAPSSPDMIIEGHYGGYNSLWDDTVVWFVIGSEGDDIRGYSFSTESFIEITDDEPTQMFPRLHGTRVVYQDHQLGTSDSMGDWNHAAIYMHDISTTETTQITSGEWIASYPDIHNNIIVWADYRDSASPNNKNSFTGVEIWGYNIETETEFKITNLPGRSKTMPRIWGDKVFFDMVQTTSGGFNAIYMIPLPDGAT